MTEKIRKAFNYENLKTIKYTHLATTIEYARAIGEELGFSSDKLHIMEVGAALHDIGKSLIPAEILNKQGKLTDEERRLVDLHSVLGYEILKSAGFGIDIAEIARDHHNPLSKNVLAQIVRAADIYSAMREQRSYKKAKSHEEAMSVIKSANVPDEIACALEKRYGNKLSTNPIKGFVSHVEVA